MSSSKTIQFNPAFFSGSGKVKSPTNKREKKEKPEVSVKPNKMKKQLLAKIKDFQNNTEKEGVKKREEEEFDKGFADEFNKSLNFLSELSKQRKQKPNRNETLKKGKVEHAVHLQISTELPEELKLEPMRINPMPKIAIIKPHAQPVQAPMQAQRVQAPRTQQVQPIQAQRVQQVQQIQIQAQIQAQAHTQTQQIQAPTLALKPNPMYSNLKGGSRPTYRQYHNKTQKNYGNEPVVKPLIQIENVPAALVPAALVPAALVPAVAASNSRSTPATKTRFKKRITRTLKYSLGKHKNGKVSVLIKNAKTRRRVQTEQALLKQKSIPDIKLYLRSKNLLKVGSDVPNDVLRQMYENAILAGDVTNKSKDTLIHNFLNDK